MHERVKVSFLRRAQSFHVTKIRPDANKSRARKKLTHYGHQVQHLFRYRDFAVCDFSPFFSCFLRGKAASLQKILPARELTQSLNSLSSLVVIITAEPVVLKNRFKNAELKACAKSRLHCHHLPTAPLSRGYS